jgi:uncharacterized protein
MKIAGATALVTGGSRGIGAAIAEALAARGANVVVAARSRGELDVVAKSVNGHAVEVDLTDAQAVEALIPHVEREYGPVDILVNNAGMELSRTLLGVEPAQLRQISRLNFEAPMVLTRMALAGMVERERGHLVFVSSLAGSSSFPGLGPYCGTKAGLNNFAATVRKELSETPIAVTLVAPGPVDTQMWDSVETGSPTLQRTVKRFRRLHLIPKTTPSRLAKRVARAIEHDRRHVRHPRRLSAIFWLSEAPRRLTETVLAGVKMDPGDD